ncbi:MAG: hypothetical protein WC406_04910 [Methanoregula sp.]
MAKRPYRTKLSTDYYINFVNLKISVLQQKEKGILVQKHVADRILYFHTEEGAGSAAPKDTTMGSPVMVEFPSDPSYLSATHEGIVWNVKIVGEDFRIGRANSSEEAKGLPDLR